MPVSISHRLARTDTGRRKISHHRGAQGRRGLQKKCFPLRHSVTAGEKNKDYFANTQRLIGIDFIDQISQSSEVLAVEVNDEPWQVIQFGFIYFLRKRP